MAKTPRKPATNAVAVQITAPPKTPNVCPYARARQAGWEDVRAARPLNRDIVDGKPDPARGPLRDDKGRATDYGKELRKCAYAYERGRMQAIVACRLIGIPPGRLPRWPNDKTLNQVLLHKMRLADFEAFIRETSVGRGNAKRAKPAPVRIPIQGAPREPSSAMMAAALRRRRRTGEERRDILRGDR
jgi:hypothetical protein